MSTTEPPKPRQPSVLHPVESVRRFTSLKVGVMLLLILFFTLFGVQRDEEQPPVADQPASVTYPLANEKGRESLVEAEAAIKPATGNQMIELPGPPAFSILSDQARGIRIQGEVPDGQTRDQWMNAARLGARDATVSGTLKVGRIDAETAALWSSRLTALVALVRERGVAEIRVRGDAVELFGQVDTIAQSDESLKLFRAQVPDGYRVLSRFNLRVAQGIGNLAVVGESRDRPLASAADVISTTSGGEGQKRQQKQTSSSTKRQRPKNCPKSVRSLASPIYFQTNAASLTAADRKRLRLLGACLNNYARVQVTGYSDPRHSAAYNKSLSERRARAVAAGIIDGGFPASRIKVLGAGQTKEKSTREKNLKRSRRVDIRIN
ncbi:MAG: OmpA family protein [Lautropia sp.]|nr:OmpA family protein [Lautropia sp.]